MCAETGYLHDIDRQLCVAVSDVIEIDDVGDDGCRDRLADHDVDSVAQSALALVGNVCLRVIASFDRGMHEYRIVSVSYTHLTLPTIYSV